MTLAELNLDTDPVINAEIGNQYTCILLSEQLPVCETSAVKAHLGTLGDTDLRRLIHYEVLNFCWLLLYSRDCRGIQIPKPPTISHSK